MSVETTNPQLKQRPLLRTLLWILGILIVTLPIWGTYTYAWYLKSEYQSNQTKVKALFNEQKDYSEALADTFSHSAPGNCITLNWKEVLAKVNISAPYLAPESRKKVLTFKLVYRDAWKNEAINDQKKADLICFILLALHQHKYSIRENVIDYVSFDLNRLAGKSGPCRHGKGCRSCRQIEWDINTLTFNIRKTEINAMGSVLESLDVLMEKMVKVLLQSWYYKNTLKVWEERFTKWTPKSLEKFNMFKLDDN